jgi:hypothetical protein
MNKYVFVIAVVIAVVAVVRAYRDCK